MRLIGLISVAATLIVAAPAQAGSSGEIRYSTYSCSPAAPACPIIILH